MKTKIKWIAGVIFCFSGVVGLFAGGTGPVAGILWMCAGLICLPVTFDLLKSKITLFSNMNTVAKYAVVIGYWFVGTAFYPKDKKAEPIADQAKQEQQAVKVSQTEKKPEKDPNEVLNTRLKNELNSAVFEKGMVNEEHFTNIESLQIDLAVFNVWGKVIREGELSGDPANQKLAAELKQKVQQLQTRDLPKLREGYAAIVKKKLWEHDIYVELGGENNEVLSFRASVFVKNMNIKDFQEKISEIVHQFRFKQVRYQWHKNQDDFTYYKLETPDDLELMNL